MSSLVPRSLWFTPMIPGELNKLWDEMDEALTVTQPGGGLTITEDDQHVYVEAAVPGIEPKDIEITFERGMLWIRGEAKAEEKDKKRKIHTQSRRSFSYRIAVPGDIDLSKEPEASYKHGVMTVTFLKNAQAQPRRIQLKKVE